MQIRTHIGVSLDGFVASADGRPRDAGDARLRTGGIARLPEFIESCDAVVMGRTTFDPALGAPQWALAGPPGLLAHIAALERDGISAITWFADSAVFPHV